MSSLTEDERQLAIIMGLQLGPSKTKVAKKKVCSNNEPYILITDIKCNLCGHVRRSIFRMEKFGSYLQGQEIAYVPEGEKITRTSYSTRRCFNCHNYLRNISKEDIITKFLDYIKEGSNF